MAWYRRYRIPFTSIGSTHYMVYINEKTSGQMVTLTGAEDPFTTQEDDNEDIFTPIRVQTGYLRVIDETGGALLQQLMPANNVEKMVELYTGTWDSTGTTFTDGRVMWRGFLQSQAYTQPWDGQKNIIEMPVKSLLGALKDVELSSNLAADIHNIAYLLVSAFDAIERTPLSLYICSDLRYAASTVLPLLIQNAVYFSKKEICNEGDTYTEIIGASYYDIIESICLTLGLQAREDYGSLYLAQYDMLPNYNFLTYELISWSELRIFASGGTGSYTRDIYSDFNLLDRVSFKGNDNVQGYIPGAKSVQVELSINEGAELDIELPQTTEDASNVYQVPDIYRGYVYTQPHAPRVNSIETFTFSEYQQVGASSSNRVGSSTYAKCLANCVINRPLYDPHYSNQDNLHTGAFPCRWYYKREQTATPSLVNGIFLNQQYLGSGWSFTPYYCYSLQSSISYTYYNGYLRIDMDLYNFMRGQLAGDRDKLYFGEFTTIWGDKPQTKLFCILTWGNKEWDGTSWITHSGNYQTFEIDFDGASIKTNKTDDILTEEDHGYFIPITSSMSGTIKLYILNVSSCESGLGMADNHSKIIANIKVEYTRELNMVASKRGSNVYRETIAQSGFSNEKAITLNIGTNNNNIDSNVFIKTDSTTYLRDLQYRNILSLEIKQRPEIHLLMRLSNYYQSVRQILKAVLQIGNGYMYFLYRYQQRKFFGVKSKTNWRDDTEEVKFIEVP